MLPQMFPGMEWIPVICWRSSSQSLASSCLEPAGSLACCLFGRLGHMSLQTCDELRRF